MLYCAYSLVTRDMFLGMKSVLKNKTSTQFTRKANEYETVLEHWISVGRYILLQGQIRRLFNPLPDMPILGSSNSAGNKNIMSKI